MSASASGRAVNFTLDGSGFKVLANPLGDPTSATLNPGLTPSFATVGLPQLLWSGTTGSLTGLAIAFGSAVLMRPHVVNVASGMNCRVFSTFSGSPSTNTIGT